MSKNLKLGFVLLITLFYFTSIAWAHEEELIAQVTNIVDGDTFDINTGDRIRLADVNASEIKTPEGIVAKNYLSSLIMGKTIILDIDDVYRYDYRGTGSRLVCLVYITYSDTHLLNINEKMVDSGHAAYKDYDNEFSPPWSLYHRYADDPPPPPPPPPPKPKEYELSIHLEGQGIINHTTGTSTYEENTEITITATPKEYWKIENWVLNGETLTNQNKIKLKITQDTQLDIQFSIFLPDCSIHFKIIDEYGKPLENAALKTNIRPEPQNRISLVSGVDGEAEIAPLYHGNYLFKIEKEGYNSRTIEIWLDKDEARYEEISLEITKIELSLTLTDSNGNLLVGVDVLSTGQPENQEQISGVSSDEGVVIFSEVLPGSYSFDILGDYVDSQIEIESGTSETSFDERITLFSELTGFVYDKDGNPLGEVEVFSIGKPSGQESLSCVCYGRYNFSRVLSGSYIFTYQKTGYMPVNRSIFLMEGTTGVIGAVTLFPKQQNYSPFITAGLLIGTVIVAWYLGSDKSFLFKSTTPEQPINELSGPPDKVERVDPLHFGTDKGVIIKTICVNGFLSLDDVEKFSGLDNDVFMKAFYGLLSDGEVETTVSGLYKVRIDVEKQWQAYM